MIFRASATESLRVFIFFGIRPPKTSCKLTTDLIEIHRTEYLHGRKLVGRQVDFDDPLIHLSGFDLFAKTLACFLIQF